MKKVLVPLCLLSALPPGDRLAVAWTAADPRAALAWAGTLAKSSLKTAVFSVGVCDLIPGIDG